MTIQHLKNFFYKIQVHPTTCLYFLLSLLGGYLKWYLSALALVCIHELFHLVIAHQFHFSIEKIEILPFGAYLSLNDFYYHPLVEEMCVVFAGPCSHFFLYFLIVEMTQGVYCEYLLEMNTWVFAFNLLPIYPLDGGRFIGLLLQRFIDLKSACYFQLKISVFSLCVLIAFYLRMNTLVIISYLIVQQFLYYRYIPFYLRQVLSSIPSYCHYRVIVHECLEYRRGFHNYYLKGEEVYDEKEMVFELLKTIQ